MASVARSNASPADASSQASSSVTITERVTYTGPPDVPTGGVRYVYLIWRINGGTYDTSYARYATNQAYITASYTLTGLDPGDRVEWESFAQWWEGATATMDWGGLFTEPHRYFTVAADATGPTFGTVTPADAASAAPASADGVRFTATITDAYGVDSVELWVDAAKVHEVTDLGYDLSYDYSHDEQLTKGAHNWYLKATDVNGNSTTLATRTLTVTNADPDWSSSVNMSLNGTVYILSVTNPTSVGNGSSVTVTWPAAVDWNAEDTLTYLLEERYNGGAWGTVYSGAALSTVWTPSQAAADCDLRLSASDGTTSTSYKNAANIIVISSYAPSDPAVTAPTTGATWREGETQTVAWDASTDADADPITYEGQFSALGDFTDAVDIFSGVSAGSYAWTLATTLVAADTATCKVRVRARDASSMVSSYSTSDAFTVQLNVMPTITWVSPADRSTQTTQTPVFTVLVNDADAGDNLWPEIEVSEVADFSAGVITADAEQSQAGWEHAATPFNSWAAFPSTGTEPAYRARWTCGQSLRFDTYYVRARVTDGILVSDWCTPIVFVVAPSSDAPITVTSGVGTYATEGLVVTLVTGGDVSEITFSIPRDVFDAEPIVLGTGLQCAVNIGGTGKVWNGTVEELRFSGAYVAVRALLDDAYLSRKLATGDVASKDLGQAFADLVTSYGAPLTGTAIDTTLGVTAAVTGNHLSLREHLSNILTTVTDEYVVWVDATADVHLVATADIDPPLHILTEA